MGSTIKKQFFLFNQTAFGVAAGEPHPQPRYQTPSKWYNPYTYKLQIYILTIYFTYKRMIHLQRRRRRRRKRRRHYI